SVFPHKISNFSDSAFAGNPQFSRYRRFDALLPTPMGNDLTVRFAEAAMQAEQLGKDSVTDILTVSFSSPDYCGHTFGPNSHEIEDMYVRLDRQLAGFFAYIDSAVGLRNTVIVLSADHGVSPLPDEFPKKDAARLNGKEFLTDIKVRIGQKFNYNEGNENLILSISNDYIILDYKAIDAHGFNRAKFEIAVGDACLKEGYISRYFTRSQLELSLAAGGSKDPIQRKIEHGFNTALSGGVALVTVPHTFFSGGTTGTTHGSVYEYDTHVPLLFFGSGINHGTFDTTCSPNDISTTLAKLLDVHPDQKSAGRVLTTALESAK
ncbi:MAG: alkaline phosphatase family protein, partial [Bacteroidota bacterium]|nr:alkaline phosphatase family protein [Bacteroidota bacterium]